MSTQKRLEKLRELHSRGIEIPHSVSACFEDDQPSAAAREWSWHAHIRSKPDESNWESSYELEEARSAWEISRDFVRTSLQRNAEWEARGRIARAERQRRFDIADILALSEDLRREYLASPGATEEGFGDALHGLLQQRARAAALGEDTVESPLTIRDILQE